MANLVHHPAGLGQSHAGEALHDLLRHGKRLAPRPSLRLMKRIRPSRRLRQRTNQVTFDMGCEFLECAGSICGGKYHWPSSSRLLAVKE
jgi:hypothetical protein